MQIKKLAYKNAILYSVTCRNTNAANLETMLVYKFSGAQCSRIYTKLGDSIFNNLEYNINL